MSLKKKLAGAMAFAMAVTALPVSVSAVPDTVEAAAETISLPAAKYELSLEGNLNLEGPEGASAFLVSAGRGAAEGEGTFVEGYNGQAFSTGGTQGVEMKNVAVDDTYTVSVWTNLPAAPGSNCPLVFVVNPADGTNWLGMAGLDSNNYQLWYQDYSGNTSVGNAPYKLGQWVNYVLSVDGTTSVLYENGEKVIEGTGDRIRNANETKSIVLGANSWSWDGVANCLYDEVKIYDEALDEAQIRALYNDGTGISLSAEVQAIRPGKTTEITAEVIGYQEGDIISWESSAPDIAEVDENGIVTGKSQGTAVITGKVVRGEDDIASAEIEITVLQEKGNLIAEFTFDDEESGFTGAGAAAVKANAAEGLSITEAEGHGNVLKFDSQPGGDYNWLNVTKDDEEKSSLLSGVKEFTVSYDSASSGDWQNCWTFFADEADAGTPTSQNAHYLAILDFRDYLTINRHGEDISDVRDSAISTEWKHIDVVFGEHKTELFVNGVLLGSRENTYTVEDCLGDNSILMIGKSTWGNEYWNGLLDNYKIYDYALTAEEIASVPVNSIEVTADSSTMYEGETLQLAATVAPDDAADKTVEWTTSDPDVAAVDENGLVTAKAAGDVTITATAQDKDGKSGSIDLTVKAALTYHEAKEPTCAETGNIEYWTDAEGNYYKDAGGMELITAEETVIPATGIHDYSVTWKWSKVDDYTVSATFTCNVCGEAESVDAEISSSTVEGITTYTAKAVFNGEAYTATKETADQYILIVEGGMITSGQKDAYSYADKVTVTADESKDGKYFSGWYVEDTLVSQKQVYTFFVLSDMTVTAKYEGEDVIKEQPVVTFGVSERQSVSGTDYNKVALTVQWSLPADYEFAGAGIIRSYSEHNDEEFRLEDVDGSDIRVQKTTLTNKNGTYKYNLTMSATTKLKTVYARGYVTYKDSEGIEYTVYTDIAESAYTGI